MSIPDSEAKKRWDRENTVNFAMKLNKNTDEDIIAKLEKVPNKAGYVKKIIRADIKAK